MKNVEIMKIRDRCRDLFREHIPPTVRGQAFKEIDAIVDEAIVRGRALRNASEKIDSIERTRPVPKPTGNRGPVESAFLNDVSCPDGLPWKSIRAYFLARAERRIMPPDYVEHSAAIAADYVAHIDAAIAAEQNAPLCEVETENAKFREMIRALSNRAWMRGDLREADELAAAVGDQLPSEHERSGG